jgi:hypothetical protein
MAGAVFMIQTAVKSAGAKGRGLFAEQGFQQGQTIAVSPTVLLSRGDSQKVLGTALATYVFMIDGRCVVPFGEIAMCNHDDNPNAIVQHEDDVSRLRALRYIEAGEEITVHYSPTGIPE